MLQGRSSGGRWAFSILVKSGFDAALWQGAGGRIPQEGGPLDQGGPSKPGRQASGGGPRGQRLPTRSPAQITAGPRRSREGEADGGGGGGPTGRGKRG